MRRSLGRVVVVLLGKDLHAERDGLVAQVGLGKAERQVARKVADIGLDGEGFAEAEEVVGLVVEPDERAGQAGDAAVQADRVLALFLQLQQEVDGAVVGVLTGLDVGVGLEGLEVVELVQAQQRKVDAGDRRCWPSSTTNSRRMTLSRVMVLPWNSMREM